MKPVSTATENEAMYRRYIDCLNDHLTSDLSDFVQEDLTYNGRPMTRLGYQNLIAADIAAIPDLHFDIQLLVVEGDRIACRILFECTPQHEFMGVQPNAKPISFAEHVFYQLCDGKIAEVWSLLDRPAIEQQLAS